MLHTKVWRRGIVVKYFTRISVKISCKIAEDHSAAQADQVDANDVFTEANRSTKVILY